MQVKWFWKVEKKKTHNSVLSCIFYFNFLQFHSKVAEAKLFFGICSLNDFDIEVLKKKQNQKTRQKSQNFGFLSKHFCLNNAQQVFGPRS